MAERLTEIGMFINTPTYIIKNGKKSEAVDKLAQLEDIMEKYGIDIQNLDYILKDYSKNQGRDFAICEERDTLRQERDTWHKACELACKTLEVPNGFCAERRCSDKMCYECLMETFYKRTSERN